MQQLKLYDTTLRDGMQGPGMSLSAREKLRLVRALDRLGVHFIEAGFPASNPKEAELFELLAAEQLETATVCGFGMTRRRGAAAAEDESLRVLAESAVPAVTLVGKSWTLHLEKVTRVSREENLEMIAESVAFCRESGKRVIYDAEHFFDGYVDDPGYALECLRAAVDAGAENVTLCDTNGGSLPDRVGAVTGSVHEQIGAKVEVGIHTHNDAECGVANTLAAVGAGARLVQGTINGYGERCGNANLVSILPALQLKMGFEVVSDEQLGGLTGIAHFVDELLNETPDPAQPYVGRNAFAHKGGMHVAGVNTDPRTFEHADPAIVGNSREVLVSEVSGRGTIRSRAAQSGVEIDDEAAQRTLQRLKQREHAGYHYEAADASFELLLRRQSGDYVPLFRLESFRVITEKREDGKVQTEATIKVWVEGERYIRVAEGNGPVNALDRALRGAIIDRHPHLADIELTNYKVRILDSDHGTGAVTRVLLDSSDGEREWGTIGVSENIIEASWEALVESLEYAFQPRGLRGGLVAERSVPPARPRERTDPARAPGDRAARGGAGGRGAALGQALAGPDAGALRARVRRLARGRGRGRGLQRDCGAAPRGAGSRLGEGRRGPDQPLQLRRFGELPALRGSEAGVLRRRPRDPQHRPGRRRGRCRRAHRGDPAGGHLRLPGGARRARPGRRATRSGDARRRLRGPRRGRRRGGQGRRPREHRHLRLLRQQADDDGGGGRGRALRAGGRGAAALGA